MYIVTVKFLVKPGKIDIFMPAMLQQAADSIALEPACRQFDVCLSDTNPNLVFLYEAYDTKADFEAHLETEHFAAFSEKVDDLVASKEVEIFSKQS